MLTWSSSEVVVYAHRIAATNVWRFRGELDAADLVQEFAIAFLKAKAAHITSRGPAALMYLYKQQVWWTLASLMRLHLGKYAVESKQYVVEVEGIGGFERLTTGDDQWLSDIRMTLDDAPRSIKVLIRGILSGAFDRQVVGRVGLKPSTAKDFREYVRGWWETNIGPVPA